MLSLETKIINKNGKWMSTGICRQFIFEFNVFKISRLTICIAYKYCIV